MLLICIRLKRIVSACERQSSRGAHQSCKLQSKQDFAGFDVLIFKLKVHTFKRDMGGSKSTGRLFLSSGYFNSDRPSLAVLRQATKSRVACLCSWVSEMVSETNCTLRCSSAAVDKQVLMLAQLSQLQQ